MRKIVIILLFQMFFLKYSFGQNQYKCSVLDVSTDTIVCNDTKLIVELNFCEENGLYQYGAVTDLKGKEEFCFFYKYSDDLKIKKITIWTFKFDNGVFKTLNKIGVLKINSKGHKLSLKKNFFIDLMFLKSITKLEQK